MLYIIFSMHTQELSTTKIPKTPFKFILFIATRFKFLIGISLVLVLLAAVLGQFISYFFKLIIDASESGETDKVFVYALLYPVAHFVIQGLYRLSGFAVGTLAPEMKKQTSDILSEYVLEHSHTYFSNRFAGGLLTKIKNVIGGLDQFIPDLFWTHIPAFVGFVITTTVIMRVDAFSGFLFIVLVITLLVTNRFFTKKKKELSYKSAEASTKLSGVTVDVLTNISAVRQYVQTKNELVRMFNASAKWRDTHKESWHYTEKMLSMNTGIVLVFGLGIFYLLVNRWSEGVISTGLFVFIIALYAQMLHTLLFIGRAFNNTARAFGEMEEGLSEILLPHDIIDEAVAQQLTAGKGEIKWESVFFKYQDTVVFDNFDLSIKAGERIGLVGSSGAGKTTFVSLLLRQHDVQGGSISIDGQNIAEVTQDSLREHIAVVPQEPMLFHRSIKENIAYGKPHATDEEIIEVAKKAQAHEFIITLEKGYDTLVGERGVKLSGGQKQRVAIARAMLKNAPILILDEATSALDSESEVAIQKALHELMEGKTVIAIAHRLSTLREMDRIIVLEKGKITEEGTHTQLVKKKGVYARLWEHQAGGFLVE